VRGHNYAKRRAGSAIIAVALAKRNLLKEISTSIEIRPSAGLIYGPPGSGKTSTCGQQKGVVCQPFTSENSYGLLKQSGAVRPDLATLPAAESWSDVLDGLDALATGDHKFTTYVLDTISCAERMCHEHVCQRDFGGDWGERGFAGYQRGFEVSLNEWRGFLDALDLLRDSRSMGIILIGHAQIKEHRDPRMSPFDRWGCDIHKKTFAITNRWCDYVFFNTFLIDVTEEGNRSKAHGGDERVFCVNPNAAYEAKNRFGMEEDIPAGDSPQEAWKNIVESIKNAKNAKNGGE